MRSKIRKLTTIILASIFTVADIRRVLFYKLSKKKCFFFNSYKLNYFFHSYNNFRLTERAIEIPIIKHYLEQGDYQNILEIGNVTNHYYDCFREVLIGKKKTVVDKYELASNVINMDICEYDPGMKFDLVFSISTFEHMDSDRGRNPDHIEGKSKLLSVAADNVKYVSDRLLAKGGKFVITAPIGYSSEWDTTFYSTVFDKCNFASYRKFVLKKQEELVWQQIEAAEGKEATYNYPLPGVNYLSVIEFNK